MAFVEKSTVVKAPLERIFAFWNDPANLPDLWPSIAEVRDVQSLEGGGTRFKFTFKAAGITLRGVSEDVEFVPNEYVINETKGGIRSRIKVTFEPEGEATRVSIRNDYTVPIPLLGKLAEVAVLKQNEQEAEMVLANLKARMES